MAFGHGSQTRLTILYCSTDRLCRCGAPMENLAHSAFLHPEDNIAPSNPGIKHLAGFGILRPIDRLQDSRHRFALLVGHEC
jgi:hypothetical protein